MSTPQLIGNRWFPPEFLATGRVSFPHASAGFVEYATAYYAYKLAPSPERLRAFRDGRAAMLQDALEQPYSLPMEWIASQREKIALLDAALAR